MQRLGTIVRSALAVGVCALLAGGTVAGGANRPWKLALTSNRQGDSEIYSMNADGTGVHRLTRTPGYDGATSAWSPDGRKLLYYTQDRRIGNPEVFVMNADGSGKRNLSHNRAWDSPGGWSPDGRRIVFTTNRDGNNELYVMDADGSGQRILSPSPSSEEYAGGWLPDGRTILFTTDRDGNWELYAVNADGSNPRNLTRSPGDDGHNGGFAASPDGRRIVFASTRDTRDLDNAELYVMNADGGGVRRLTRTKGTEGVISWSPDGRKLAFGRFPVKPRWAFFVMNADGSGARKVTWSLPGRR